MAWYLFQSTLENSCRDKQLAGSTAGVVCEQAAVDLTVTYTEQHVGVHLMALDATSTDA
jgi:hypothetical protein